MQRRKMITAGVLAALVLGGSLVATPATAETYVPSTGLTSTERDDGTFLNPVTGSDVPDVSTIRVLAKDAGGDRDVYYMVSTTMELSPGTPILRSYDLVNWEIVTYVYDILEITDSNALRNGASAYGEGQWASSLQYHDGTFYVLMNSNNNGHAYLFSTTDIERGTWTKHSYDRGFHDPSLYFDPQSGKAYIFYGGTNVVELSDDLRTPLSDRVLIDPADYDAQTITDVGQWWEGTQVTYANGYYYHLAISYGKFGRQTLVFRSKDLLGRLTELDGSGNPINVDAHKYELSIGLGNDAIAQGGFVSVGDPELPPTHAMLFKDDYPTGRIPTLVPVTWSADPDGWPVLGTWDEARGVGSLDLSQPLSMPVQLTAAERRLARTSSVVTSDDFENDAEHRDFTPISDDDRSAGEGPADGPTELVSNGDFADGATGWEGREQAELTVVAGADAGSASDKVMLVTGRSSTGDGASQWLDVTPGASYEVSFGVKYVGDDLVADTKEFLATVDYMSDPSRWVNLVGATAVKGEWTTVRGTFTVPTDRDVSQFLFYVENPWGGSDPALAPDYYLSDVKVTRLADPELFDPAESTYNGSDLDLPWQWGHNPDNRYWSLTDRPGWLQLTNGSVVTGTSKQNKPGFYLTRFEEARNLLSQRTFAPTSSAETRLDFSDLTDGDLAGLAVYNRQISYVAIKQDGTGRTLGIVNRDASTTDYGEDIAEDFITSVPVPAGQETVSLKADLDLRTSGARSNTVQFYYSWDDVSWHALGAPQAKFAGWDGYHFKGQRFGLFNYATKQVGGVAAFDHYLLSKTLTADGAAVSTTQLAGLVAEAGVLKASDYSAESWAVLTKPLSDAKLVAAPRTQNQVDARAQALERAIASLEPVEPVEVTEPVLTPTSVSVGKVSAPYGQKVSLPVKVAGTTSGQVSVQVGSKLETASVDTSGGALLTLPERLLPVGTHTLTVRYSGTASAAASSTDATVTVSRATTTVTASAAKVKAGQKVTVNVVVRAAGLTPAGTVTVTVAGVSRTATLTNGRATVKVAVPKKTKPGRHKVAVSYAGATTTAPSSATATASIVKARSRTTVKVTRTKVRAGKKVSVRVTVRASGLVPSGKVTVKVAGRSRTATLKNGKATVKVTLPRTTSPGRKTVTVSYRGSGHVTKSSVKGTVRVVRG